MPSVEVEETKDDPNSSSSSELSLPRNRTGSVAQSFLVKRGSLNDVQSTLSNFREARIKEKKRHYEIVISRGIGTAALGMVVVVLGVAALSTGSATFGRLLSVIGVFFTVSGMILMSTCPVDDLDVDRLFLRRKLTRVCMGLFLSMFSFAVGISSYFHMLGVIPALRLSVGHECCPARRAKSSFLSTTLFSIWLCSTILATGLMYLVDAVECSSTLSEMPFSTFSNDTVPEEFSQELACEGKVGPSRHWRAIIMLWAEAGFHVVTAVCLIKYWYEARRKYKVLKCTAGASPTAAFYHVVYSYFTCGGVAALISGTVLATLSDSSVRPESLSRRGEAPSLTTTYRLRQCPCIGGRTGVVSLRPRFDPNATWCNCGTRRARGNIQHYGQAV